MAKKWETRAIHCVLTSRVVGLTREVAELFSEGVLCDRMPTGKQICHTRDLECNPRCAVLAPHHPSPLDPETGAEVVQS